MTREENAMVQHGHWPDGNEDARHQAKQDALDAEADATEDDHDNRLLSFIARMPHAMYVLKRS
jgi:hypothetical protein